jgi:hypothetical protein
MYRPTATQLQRRFAPNSNQMTGHQYLQQQPLLVLLTSPLLCASTENVPQILTNGCST